MAVAAGTAVRAQLNNNAAPELPHLTDIYADGSADFDGIGHTATYRDNVCVSNSEMQIDLRAARRGFAPVGRALEPYRGRDERGD